jgi:outer membrane immunogenic protein
MKKTLLSIALTAGFAGSALAADLPVKSPRYVEHMATTNWTGCYIGAGAGYGMWNQEHQSIDPSFVPIRGAGTVTNGGRGWLGTVQVGCDYQFMPRWVAGVFADYDFGNLKGNLSPSAANNFVGEEKMKSSWAVGGRLGYVVFPQLLAYVSGGYTQARFDGVTFIDLTGGGPLSMAAQTYHGWFLGSGYEYALDFIPGLNWKTEYRFAEYRSESPGLFNAAGTLVGYERSEKYVQTIRSELVYRFNWGGGPVVARY